MAGGPAANYPQKGRYRYRIYEEPDVIRSLDIQVVDWQKKFQKRIKPADLGGNRRKLWKESGMLKWGQPIEVRHGGDLTVFTPLYTLLFFFLEKRHFWSSYMLLIWGGEVEALNCRMSAMNPIFTDLVNLKEPKRPTGKEDLSTRRENATVISTTRRTPNDQNGINWAILQVNHWCDSPRTVPTKKPGHPVQTVLLSVRTR